MDIPRTRHLKYLQDNFAAAEISLTDAELAHLTSIVPPDAVAGTREDETEMKRLGL